jgi:2-polyprenyl-3-methyl-5-hydroxy-6-metoxy-1,4-benzoquinol methylase
MNPTQAGRGDIPAHALPATRAARIAAAFAPAWPFGNRYDQCYARLKLGTDPLYPGVLAALRGSSAPLLDLGCGLGLLAHALRDDGQALAYRGVDLDAAKIRRAARAAERARLAQVAFARMDLARTLPAHRGSVAVLDVLQYLSAERQHALVAALAAMLTPGARLVIRTGLRETGARSGFTRLADRLAHGVGWMQVRPRHFPDQQELAGALADAGLRARFAPLRGRTPFNNWLVVAEAHGER